MTQVFISYSRRDKDFASKFTTALHKSELDTWIDWEDIPPVADWLDQIHKGIEQSDGFLFLLSPDSIASKVCKQEVDHAVQNAKRLIPIVAKDVDPGSVHPALSKVNWVYCREQDDFDEAIKKTLQAIKTDLAWVESHRRLQVRALEWEKRSDSSLLLRGKDLREAEEQLASVGQKDPPPTDLQRKYTLESRRHEGRTRNMIIAIGAVVLVALIFLSIFANNQRILADHNEETAIANANSASTEKVNAENQKATAVVNANISLARQLAAQAELAGTGYQEDVEQLRGLLAVESLRRYPTASGDQSLRSLGDFWKSTIADLSGAGYMGLGRLSEDGRWMAMTTENGVVIQDTTSPGTVYTIRMDAGPLSLLFSPDGKWLADETGVWEVKTGVRKIVFSQDELFSPLAFSPDGNLLLLLTEDNQMQVLTLDTNSYISITPPEESNYIVDFSRDGMSVVFVGGNGQVRIWGSVSGTLTTSQSIDSSFTDALFSPDGKWLVTADLNSMELKAWDTSTWKNVSGQKMKEIPFSGSGLITFSNDGKYVASKVSGSELMVWKLEDGSEVARLQPDNGGEMESVAFSPDNQWIAAGDFGGIAHIWEIATKTETVRVQLDSSGLSDVSSILFSADGTWIISADSYGKAFRWVWRTKDLIDSACKGFLSRNFYTKEWSQYLGSEIYRPTCPNFEPKPIPTSTLFGYFTAVSSFEGTSQPATMTPPAP